MGLIVNQGIKNSLSFYLGMAIAAIITILISRLMNLLLFDNSPNKL